MSCVTTAARMSTKFPRTKPRYTLDNSFMQGTGTHNAHPGHSQLKPPLSHGLDWAELASNICLQGMCLDHIRGRSQSRRSKLSTARSIVTGQLICSQQPLHLCWIMAIIPSSMRTLTSFRESSFYKWIDNSVEGYLSTKYITLHLFNVERVWNVWGGWGDAVPAWQCWARHGRVIFTPLGWGSLVSPHVTMNIACEAPQSTVHMSHNIMRTNRGGLARFAIFKMSDKYFKETFLRNVS